MRERLDQLHAKRQFSTDRFRGRLCHDLRWRYDSAFRLGRYFLRLESCDRLKQRLELHTDGQPGGDDDLLADGHRWEWLRVDQHRTGNRDRQPASDGIGLWFGDDLLRQFDSAFRLGRYFLQLESIDRSEQRKHLRANGEPDHDDDLRSHGDRFEWLCIGEHRAGNSNRQLASDGGRVRRCDDLCGRINDDPGGPDRCGTVEPDLVRWRHPEWRDGQPGNSEREPELADRVHGYRRIRRELPGDLIRQRDRDHQLPAHRFGLRLGHDHRLFLDASERLRRCELLLVTGHGPEQRQQLLTGSISRKHHDLHADGCRCQCLYIHEQRLRHGDGDRSIWRARPARHLGHELQQHGAGSD